MSLPDVTQQPPAYRRLLARSETRGFAMPSDMHVGSLLRALTASKSAARVLELGTGMGLSLAWLLDGLDAGGSIVSIDNDAGLVGEVRDELGGDERLELVAGDGGAWLEAYAGPPFDLVFADTWPGKYHHLDEALALVAPRGFYCVDDMREQPNWPEGHAAKAAALAGRLEREAGFACVKLDWSTGVVLLTRMA